MIMKKILFLLTMVVFASAKSQDTCITDARTYTNTNITQNGVRAITAQKLNTSLNKIIDAIECVEGGVFVSTDSNTVINYDVLNSQNTPPGSPATGDIYLVGNSPSGAWVGHAKDIAEWNGSAWVFTDGVQGDFLYNATNALTYIFRSGNWVQTTGIPALNNGNTISSGLTIGTNNARSLNFETNNINRGRFDSIGRFHIYNLPTSSTGDTFVTLVNTLGKFTKQGKSTFLAGVSGGGGSPGGSDTQIQYNSGGAFGADSGFTRDVATGNTNISATYGSSIYSFGINNNIFGYGLTGSVNTWVNGSDLGIQGFYEASGFNILTNSLVISGIEYGNVTKENGEVVIGNLSGGNGTKITIDDVNEHITISNLPAYDDDTAAGVGGLTAGMVYMTTGSGAAPLNTAGILMIKQ